MGLLILWLIFTVSFFVVTEKPLPAKMIKKWWELNDNTKNKISNNNSN